MEAAGKYLGITTANVLNTLNPSILAYTGGGAYSPVNGPFFKTLLEVTERDTLPEAWDAATIVKNPDAKRYGVLGAAAATF